MESALSLTEKKRSFQTDQNVEMERFQYKLQSFIANWEDFLYLLGLGLGTFIFLLDQFLITGLESEEIRRAEC